MSNVILDTDFLYGLFVESDPHHRVCQEGIPQILAHTICVPNVVVYELATLLSRRIHQKAAIEVLQQLEMLDILFIVVDNEMHTVVMKEFQRHAHKNVSAVDCANVALARAYNAKIVSFDKFYSEDMRFTFS